MAHLHPDRLRQAMADASLDTSAVAAASGLRIDFLEAALAGERRLDVAAMRAIAPSLAIDWWALRCDHTTTRQRRCAGCKASNELSEQDLADATAAIRLLLEQAATAGRDLADASRLPAFEEARSALRAIGAELDAKTLASVSPADSGAIADFDDAARRLATYCARGDAVTDELIGLDIDVDLPDDVPVAGWTLHRFTDSELTAYEVLPLAQRQRSWDRFAAGLTCWLHRPAGMHPAVSDLVITVSEPRDIAAAPLLALSLVGTEPPAALSHGWAQRGRGVSLSAMSRELDYLVDDDGLPHVQYGPYRVDAARRDEWSRHLAIIGGLAETVFATNSHPARRYVENTRQFLTVAADLHTGWEPLPRLALELSTVIEMLVVDGVNAGEVARRVRYAAAWLGGVDDADRRVIERLANTIYDAGSKYRHGGKRYRLHHGGKPPTVKEHLDVLHAYRLLRRLMLHGLAVVAAGESVAELCDKAQLGEHARNRLAEIINALYADLGVARTPFPT